MRVVDWPCAHETRLAAGDRACRVCLLDSSLPSSSPSPSPSTSEPVVEPTKDPPSPSEAPDTRWQQAVETTSAADALLVDVQFLTNVEGFERITAGTGYVEPGTGFGDVTWTDDLGVSREVISSSGHFLEIDGAWFELEEESQLPTTTAFDPLAALKTATNVVDIGPEEVNGVPSIRLEADLDDADATVTMGFSNEERTVFDESANAAVTATIWIDSEGRIIRMIREFTTVSLDGDPISATSLFLLDALAQTRPIDVSQTADALPAPI